MANDHAAKERNSDEQQQKEIYTYEAPWNNIYAMNWSVRKDKKYRLGIGSILASPDKISIVQLDVKTCDIKANPKLCFDQQYPATKIMFIPDKECQKPDLLATTAEHLRIWQVRDDNDQVDLKSVLNNNKNSSSYCKPLTSFDWNEYDPKRIGTCSTDTICTIWDIDKESVDTQMIAHNQTVYDIAWGNANIFGTASGDGFARIFDTRNKDNSLIIYENSQPGIPLIRLGWNKQDPMYMATIILGSPKVVVLDIRRPAVPLAELNRHSKIVNAIAWAPHSSSHICSVGNDSQAFIWDLSSRMQSEPVDVEGGLDPILVYNAGNEIDQLQWSSAEPDWLAITYSNKLQILRV